MGEINQIQKNRSKKKWGREEWIILILAGVFLLIVFMPSFENDKKDNDFEKNFRKSGMIGNFLSQ